MKYVILKLLKDKPRHGYEGMKEREEQLHGCYSPSPGTVYPTLQWLEDEGLVVAKDVEGKKVYEITDVGAGFSTSIATWWTTFSIGCAMRSTARSAAGWRT